MSSNDVRHTPTATEFAPARLSRVRAGFAQVQTVFVIISFFLLSLLIQRVAGAPRAAFGAFPDESAHYVAGVATHDYLVHGLGKNPIQFFRDYYLRRPFFAIGVWPPFFYVIEAGWMSLFGEQRDSVLWLIALSASGLATLVYSILKRRYDGWTGVAGGAILLLVPVVQWSLCQVMVDLTCSLFALISIVFFARFVDRKRWQDSLLFGLFCGLALLTKNSTYFVLLVPPIVIAATRRWDLLRKPHLWVAAAIVTAMYLPWLLISRSVLLRGVHGLELPGILGIHREFIAILWDEMSFLLLLAAFGAWRLMTRKPNGIAVCLLALIPALSVGIFLARVPIQDRLLILAYVAVIFLVAECCTAVLPSKRPALMVACLIAFAAFSWARFPKPPIDHIRSAVAYLETRDGNHPGATLVPSENEGPWIAEFAENESRGPSRTLVRPTKLFGEEDWNGSNWKAYYTTAEEMQTLFAEMPVKYCVFSKSPHGRRYPHDLLLEKAVAESSQDWQLVFENKTPNGPELRIYQNLHWHPDSEPMVYEVVSRSLAKYLP